MSLIKCIKKLGLSAEEAEILMADTKDLTVDGLAAKEAAIQAVNDRIEEYQGERQDIITQLEGQGVDTSGIQSEEITDETAIQEILAKYGEKRTGERRGDDLFTTDIAGELNKLLEETGTKEDRRAPEGRRGDDLFTTDIPSEINKLLDDKKLKEYFQAEPVFYSQMQQHLEAKLPNKGTPTQIKQTVEAFTKKGQIKAEELEWSGLNEWLSEQKGKITKEEVINFLKANEIKVEEVVKGNKLAELKSKYEILFDEDENAYVVYDENGEIQYGFGGELLKFKDESRAWRYLEEEENKLRPDESGDTKFATWQLPGGENYRELLLTLPQEKKLDEKTIKPLLDDAAQSNFFVNFDELGTTEQEDVRRVVEGRHRDKLAGEAYKGGHYDEANVLAHIRFNERTDADGKRVLFVEEIQSDWHQAGRKGGYANIEKQNAFKKANKEWKDYRQSLISKYNMEGTWTIDRLMDVMTGEEITELQRLEQADTAAMRETDLGGMVLDAPFKTSWPLLAMKRVIRHAAENGFDRIAWTTGEQQAARYDLSKQVKEIAAMQARTDGRYQVVIEGKDGFELEEYRGSGKEMTESEIEDLVGKDVAKKLVDGAKDKAGTKYDDNEWVALSGGDLKVGGEGMKGFYDNMLPKMVNKYVKKWGGKVGDTDIIIGQRMKGDDRGEGAISASAHSLDITNKMRDAAIAGQTLFQDKKRGSIQFGDNETIINLFKARNLSTFLHESGHLFLDVMQDISSRPDAVPELKAEWANIEKALGLKAGQRPEVQHHEAWATQFEAYLRSGKAPSIELRSPFQAFRRWLLTVYKSLKQLLSKDEVSKELSDIFDRMLATDAEIEAAASDSYNAIFDNAENYGDTDAAFKNYQKVAQEVRDKAQEEMDVEAIREVEREKKAEWKKLYKAARTRVELEINRQKDVRAKHFLISGEFLIGDPMADVITEPIKLDTTALKDMYEGTDQEFQIRKLPPQTKRAKGGVHPDVAAEILGYKSGDEMVKVILETGNRQAMIKKETDARMKAEHGDMRTDIDRVAKQAIDALHNDKTAHFLMLELRALNKKTKTGQTQSRVLKEIANSIIETSTVPEAARSERFLTEERKAGRDAERAASEKRFDVAREAKRHQVLNHYLYMAARDAKTDQAKFLRFFKKFNKKGTRKALKGEFLDQIDLLLEKYDFSKIPLKAVEERKSLRQWVESQKDEGLIPNISDELLDDTSKTNYRELKMEEFRGLYDAIKSIETIARNDNKIKIGQELLDYDTVVQDLIDTARAANEIKRKPPIDPAVRGPMELTGSFFRGLDATLLKIEQMIAWLDGDKPNGPWHTYIFQQVADAEHARNDLDMKYTTKVIEAFEEIPEYHRTKIGQKVYVEELATDMTRGGLLAIAMNLGTKSNLFKLIDGSKQLPNGGWTEEGVRTALNKHLSEQDWMFVDKILKILNQGGEESLFNMLNKVDKDMTGTPLKKVEALPIPTPYGVLEGGYYPIVYDKRFSRAGMQDKAEFNENSGRPSTRSGSVNERIETFSAPLNLDLSAIPMHISEITQDVTHRRVVYDLYKLLTDQRIRRTIQETLGEEYEPHFRKWLSHVASDRMTDQTGVGDWMRILRFFRLNTSIVAMNFKYTTVIQQPLGITQSMDVMREMKGSKMMLTKAVTEFAQNPLAMRDFVFSKSGEMTHRMNNLDRDLRENLRRRLGKKGFRAEMIRIGFMGIGIADMAVSLPTWVASYKWALENNYTEIQAIEWADSRVRLSQGTGSAKDLSAVQRGHEAIKLLTVFYSYFNAYYGRIRDSVRTARGKGIKGGGEFILRHFWITMIPAIFSEILSGRGPDEDEEYEEWAMRKVVAYPFATVPIVRDVANAVESGFGYDWTPAAGFAEHSVRLINKSADYFEGDAEASEVAMQAVKTSGYFLGLPTAQANITFGHIVDAMEGDTDFNPYYLLVREPEE